MHTKLYGPLPELETVAFIAQTGIGIRRERRRTRRKRRRLSFLLTEPIVVVLSWLMQPLSPTSEKRPSIFVGVECLSEKNLRKFLFFSFRSLYWYLFLSHCLTRFIFSYSDISIDSALLKLGHHALSSHSKIALKADADWVALIGLIELGHTFFRFVISCFPCCKLECVTRWAENLILTAVSSTST